jgi:hypothetical protein
MTKITDLVQAGPLNDGDVFYVVQGGISFYCTGEQIKDLVEGGLTAAEVKALYEANADTNAFTDNEKSKLGGIEPGATADQTGAEIKAAYEGEANTNAFTDAEKTKLANQSGTNTGDQTSIVGITGTKAEFDAACTDGDFLYVGDVVVDPNTALTNAVNNFTAQQYFGTQTLTSGATVDWNLNTQQVAELTLDQNASLNAPTNLVAGGLYVLHVKQDSTGGWTLGFDAIFRFPGGTPPTITATADRSDVLTFFSDGTHLYLKSIEQNMDYTVAVPLAISQLGNATAIPFTLNAAGVGVAWLSTTEIAIVSGSNGQIQKYNRVGPDWVADGNLGPTLGTQTNITATSFSPTQIIWSGPNYIIKHTYTAPNWAFVTVGTVSGASDVSVSQLNATDIAWIDQGLAELRRYDVSGGAGSLSLVGSGLSIPGLVDPDVAALDANNVAVIDTGIGTLRTYQDAGGGSWSAVGTPLAIAGMSGQVKVEAISATEVILLDNGNKEMRIYENSPNWQLSAVVPLDVSGLLTTGTADFAMSYYDTDNWAFVDTDSDNVRTYQKA